MRLFIIPIVTALTLPACNGRSFLGQEKESGSRGAAALEGKKAEVIASLMNARLTELHESMIQGSTDASISIRGVVFNGLRSLLIDMREDVERSKYSTLKDFYGTAALEPTPELSPSEILEALERAQAKLESISSSNFAALSLADNCGKFQYEQPADQLSAYTLIKNCGTDVAAGATTVGPIAAATGLASCQVGYVEQIYTFTQAENELRRCEENSKQLSPASAMSKKTPVVEPDPPASL